MGLGSWWLCLFNLTDYIDLFTGLLEMIIENLTEYNHNPRG